MNSSFKSNFLPKNWERDLLKTINKNDKWNFDKYQKDKYRRNYITEIGTFVIFLNKEKLTCQCNSLYHNKYIILPCSWDEDQILNSSAGKHSKTI